MVTADETHWTHRLFVDNAHLYLPFLEDAKGRAEEETEALCRMFRERGVPERGRVLDVACGLGRHSVLLSKRGYCVTGVDISPLFVEKAREYAATESASPRFVVGDALELGPLLAPEPPFDACINMFTSHSYYGREGDVQMFSGLAELAAEGALLVVMTMNRDWLVRNFREEGFQTAGGITIRERRSLDLETSTVNNRWDFFEDEPTLCSKLLTLEMNNRVYSLHEMIVLLDESGWSYCAGYGSAFAGEIDLVPLALDSNRMWVVAQRYF